MKRFLTCLIMLITVLCVGCTVVADATLPTVAPTTYQVPEVKPMEQEQIEDMPGHEYGTGNGHMHVSDTLVARIIHPKGEIEKLDETIEKWVSDVVSRCQQYIDNGQVVAPAELNMEYNSYVVGEKLVSVKLFGELRGADEGRAIELVETFNADKQSGELVGNNELFLPQGKEKLSELLTEMAGKALIRQEGDLLKNLLVTHDGLEVTLVSGDQLTETVETKIFEMGNDELKGIIAPEITSALTPTPTPTQTPTPTPTPTPKPTPKPSRTATSFKLSKKPVIAFSFDDGPSEYTDQILDILKKYNCKATFFVVGDMVGYRKKTMKRIVAEGHEIGNHTWNHRILTRLNKKQITDQLEKTKKKIFDVTGVNTSLVRPPYGEWNKNVQNVCKELDLTMVNWSVDTLDWKSKNANKIYNSTMKNSKDCSIVLFHDTEKATVEAVERLIPDMLAMGYEFVTVSEMLAIDKEPEAGKMYYNGVRPKKGPKPSFIPTPTPTPKPTPTSSVNVTPNPSIEPTPKKTAKK